MCLQQDAFGGRQPLGYQMTPPALQCRARELAGFEGVRTLFERRTRGRLHRHLSHPHGQDRGELPASMTTGLDLLEKGSLIDKGYTVHTGTSPQVFSTACRKEKQALSTRNEQTVSTSQQTGWQKGRGSADFCGSSRECVASSDGHEARGLAPRGPRRRDGSSSS